MPRLRNRVSGVVVSVSDDTAARLGADYEPAEEKATKKATRKRASSDESEK